MSRFINIVDGRVVSCGDYDGEPSLPADHKGTMVRSDSGQVGDWVVKNAAGETVFETREPVFHVPAPKIVEAQTASSFAAQKSKPSFSNPNAVFPHPSVSPNKDTVVDKQAGAVPANTQHTGSPLQTPLSPAQRAQQQLNQLKK